MSKQIKIITNYFVPCAKCNEYINFAEDTTVRYKKMERTFYKVTEKTVKIETVTIKSNTL